MKLSKDILTKQLSMGNFEFFIQLIRACLNVYDNVELVSCNVIDSDEQSHVIRFSFLNRLACNTYTTENLYVEVKSVKESGAVTNSVTLVEPYTYKETRYKPVLQSYEGTEVVSNNIPDWSIPKVSL